MEATAATYTLHHRQTPAEAALAARAKGRIFVFEGVNGVGKTTATKRFGEWARQCLGIEAVVLSENMRDPLLTYFCGDPQHRATATQLTMECKRIFEMVEAAMAAKRGAVVFMDRSIDGDKAFALMHHGDGKISDEELAVYLDERAALLEKLRRMGDGYWPTMTGTLFMQAPTEVLKDRIRLRGDPKEVDLYCAKDPTYLDRLATAYGRALTPASQGCPVMTVDWLDDHPNFRLSDVDCQQLLTELLDLAQVPPGAFHRVDGGVLSPLGWSPLLGAFDREMRSLDDLVLIQEDTWRRARKEALENYKRSLEEEVRANDDDPEPQDASGLVSEEEEEDNDPWNGHRNLNHSQRVSRLD
jgi:deoxyadenosine/deoxycytidine kinase